MFTDVYCLNDLFSAPTAFIKHLICIQTLDSALIVSFLSWQLFRHPKYESCQRIALFLSMEDEVCTQDIIEDALGCGKSCFIPRYESGSSHMDMLKVDSLRDVDTLPRTSWNIRQPAGDDSREEALSAGLHPPGDRSGSQSSCVFGS